MNRKPAALVSALLLLPFCLAAQTNSTVDITDDVYVLLEKAEQRGLCSPLRNTRPYTERYITARLDEILESLRNSGGGYTADTEISETAAYAEKFRHTAGFDPQNLSYRVESSTGRFPVSFEFNNTTEGFVSGGVYGDSSLNSAGFELFHSFNFLGDLGSHVSYRTSGYIGLTSMRLQNVGTYTVGKWWNDPEDDTDRYINVFRNNSVLPYSYKKRWDGSVYNRISGDGLNGWPDSTSMAFGMYGEINASLLDDRIEIGAGRINREWAAMDSGSSLVLNSSAAPFMGVDIKVELFRFLSFSTLTGVLEFPNQGYINGNAWYRESPGDTVDSYFFQNAYSIAMVDLDFRYAHLDFGSTCIWPKRFELGYMFPLVDSVVYQNSVGDYDNLALFGDIKLRYPGIGSVWASLFLDELFNFKINPFEKTRCMFAYQFGARAELPAVPFMSVSFRYTKIEPYCYTHQALKYQPWYSGYISQSYTNNGSGLGYYLPPNSDEFFLRVDARPAPGLAAGLQYQLVRHGADYGSASVPGSSLYSEMNPEGRDELTKYFLRDGVYEWTSMVSIDMSYSLRQLRIPVTVTASAGYVYDWFTRSDGTGRDASLSAYETSEYPVKSGAVLSVGFRAFRY